MARSPELFTPSVGVAEGGAPFQRFDVDPNTFGAGIGAAVQKVGQGAEQLGANVTALAVERQQRFNQVAVDDAFTNLQTQARGMLFGDPTKPDQRGYYASEGRAALDGYKGSSESLEDMRRRTREGLANDAQRAEFDTMSRRWSASTLDGMARHADQQYRAWSVKVQAASEANQVQDAANYYNDPQRFGDAVEHARGAAVRGLQDKYGPNVDGAMVLAEIRRVDTNMIRARALRWAQNDAGAAEAWLKTGTFQQPGSNKQVPITEAMDPIAYDQLVRHLKANGEQQQGARAAMEAYGGASAGATPAAAWVSSPQTLANATAVRDGLVRRGIPLPAAIGLAANAVQESGARADAPVGDGGISHGLFQWNKERLDAFKAKYGKLPGQATLDEQLDFAVAELNGPERAAGDAIRAAQTPEEAARIASTRYLRPRDTAIEEPRRAGIAMVLASHGGMPNAAPTAPPSPPGATNNAPYTDDRANAYATLYSKFQKGEMNEATFAIALTRLEQLQRQDAHLRADAGQAAINDYMPKALGAPGTFPMESMLNDSRLTGQQKHSLWTIVNTSLKGNVDKPTEVSQNRRTELLDGIRAGTVTSPDQLVDAVAHGGLSTSDYNFVKARFDESRTENGRSLNKQTTELFGAVEKDIAATLVPGLSNPAAGLDFYRFKDFAYRKIADAQKEGPAKVAALFDPNSPDFLGSEANIKQFKSSLDDVMRNRMSGLTTGGKAPDPSAQPRAAPDPATLAPQEQLKADVASGKISRAEGRRIAIEKGWIKPPPGSAENPAVVRPNMVPTTP